jgi:ABC-type nitrate/sulfonate/bicarbonate transport system substrate-binding protein
MRIHTWIAFVIALVFLTAPMPAAARTKSPPFQILIGSVGPGVPEWPLYIGEELGLFERAGLSISELTAGNTQNCVAELVTGDAPIAILASDVVIAAAARKLPITYIAPVITLPTYSLVVGASIKTWSDLRGKVVLVTNKDDITAITLRKLAASQKLDWLKDFNILNSGTSQLRTVALVGGNRPRRDAHAAVRRLRSAAGHARSCTRCRRTAQLDLQRHCRQPHLGRRSSPGARAFSASRSRLDCVWVRPPR